MSYTTTDESKYKIISLILTIPVILALMALILCRYILHVTDEFWLYFYGIMGIYYVLTGFVNFKIKKFTGICDIILGISLAVLFFVRLNG